MTPKPTRSSRRAFLLSTLIATPALRPRRTGEEGPRADEQPRRRLERLVARYGSELGELRKVGR